MRPQQHLFPIIDNLLHSVATQVAEESGEVITCRMGCDHCCHLLVEISWSEAYELANWVAALEEPRRAEFLKKISDNRAEAREVFNRRPSGRQFLEPLEDVVEIPDWVYDSYFYEKKRPCAFLEDGVCQAYEARPSPCRLHVVTHDPELCRYDVEDDSDYDVPEEFEELKEELGPITSGLNQKGRWGQMAIMVAAVLKEEFSIEVE